MGYTQYTDALVASITLGSSSRFVNSQYSGLKVNSMLLDVILNPASSKSWNFDVLKELILNVNLRRKDAENAQVVENCPLWDLFSFGDFNAGVSMALAGKIGTKTAPVEISCVIPFGSFSVSIDEAVEMLLTGKPASIADYTSIEFVAKWVFVADKSSRVYGYKSFTSIGGEQSYRDVLNLFYVGPADSTINATVRDYTGSQTVNLRDAVAFANGAGRFEYFADFGHLYADPTGYSQDITVSLDGSRQLLLQQEFFSLGKLLEQDGRTLRDTESVLQGIYAVRPEKFEVLKQRGVVPSSFVPAKA